MRDIVKIIIKTAILLMLYLAVVTFIIAALASIAISFEICLIYCGLLVLSFILAMSIQYKMVIKKL